MYMYICIGTQISAVTCRPVHENIAKVTYSKVIKSLQEGESYEYLGILDAERFLGEEMKLKVSKEYLEVKIEWWKFSSRSQYLGSIPFKIFSSIY